jgi:hypothetical protein
MIAGASRAKVLATFLKRTAARCSAGCVVCHQLYFPDGVEDWEKTAAKAREIAAKKGSSVDDLLAECKPHPKDADGVTKPRVCKTCAGHIRAGRRPPNSIVNIGAFPDVPEELEDLIDVEKKLIAQRIHFMSIRNTRHGGPHGQRQLVGNVVNVPTSNDTTQSLLPRDADSAMVVSVRLKRRRTDKHGFASQVISAAKVMKALRWLKENSSLYRNITIREDWLETLDRANIDMRGGDDADVPTTHAAEVGDDDMDVDIGAGGEEDDGDIVNEREHGGPQATALFDTLEALDIAPGEGSTPLFVLADANTEELAYPTIYCGEPRKTDATDGPSYARILHSELRRIDRRKAKDPEALFFSARKLQMLQTCSAASTMVRLGKVAASQALSAGTLSRDRSFVSSLVQKDIAYNVLRVLRGSPAYMSGKRQITLGMLRQLGSPTWFWTVTISEVRDVVLIRSLYETAHGVRFDNDAQWQEKMDGLPWKERSALVRNDPVTVTRHIARRTRNILWLVRNDKDIMGVSDDDVAREEEQKRTTLHQHVQSWVKNSPK